MSRLFEALRDAADGAFVIDEDLHIVYWNKAAEAVLGFDSQDVAGQFCYQLLHGYDEGRCLICKARCRVAQLVLKSKPVPNYDIRVTTKQGDSRWLNMSVFTYRIGDADGKKLIVHLFHDLNHKKIDEKLLNEVIEVIGRYQDILPESRTETEPLREALTPREREVLALLAKSHGTRAIAGLLSISPNTVRNHIQQILQKLQVHSRLEAVTHAIKHDLID